MIANNAELAGALFQMESFADTLEGMRRHAQETEASVFATTSGGFIALLRERIQEVKDYLGTLPDTQEQRLQNNGTHASVPSPDLILPPTHRPGEKVA